VQLVRCHGKTHQPMIFQCPKCGLRLPMEAHEFPLHCVCGQVSASPTPGLGDRVAAGLRFIGVTRVVEYITGGECEGCGQRQESLNEFGKKVGL